MAIETVTVTKQEAQMIEEAKKIRKQIAEQEALKVQKSRTKARMKSKYNLAMALLLIVGTTWLLFVEGKIG